MWLVWTVCVVQRAVRWRTSTVGVNRDRRRRLTTADCELTSPARYWPATDRAKLSTTHRPFGCPYNEWSPFITGTWSDPNDRRRRLPVCWLLASSCSVCRCRAAVDSWKATLTRRSADFYVDRRLHSFRSPPVDLVGGTTALPSETWPPSATAQCRPDGQSRKADETNRRCVDCGMNSSTKLSNDRASTSIRCRRVRYLRRIL